MKVFVSGLVLMLVCAGVAQADVISIRDTTLNGDDTNVQDAGLRGGGAADQNFGIGTKPRITSDDDRGALIWFDLSSIPADQTVILASLDLRLRPPGGSAVDNDLASLSRVTEAWGAGPLPINEGTGWYTPALEGEVTWNSRMHPTPWAEPGLLTDGGGSRDMARVIDMSINDGNWHVIRDVADIVKTWIEDGDPNYGFVLNDAQNTSNYYELSTSESGSIERRPMLTVEYIPEPASLLLLTAGSVTLLLRRRRA